MTHRIAILAVPKVVGFDLTIAAQLFGIAANDRQQQLYQVTVCGVTADPIRTANGFDIVPAAGPEALETADTVVIPGTRAPGPRQHGELDPELAAAMARIPRRARLASICTGAFVLGAAGVLGGRPATTHWAHTERFRELYPSVRLDESVLYVDDGDVLTAAGLAAGTDLCLHMIRADHGMEVANRVAKYCLVPPWRDGGQSQFIEQPVPVTPGSTAATRTWALERLGERLSLAELAAHARLSTRTFGRRFAEETGMSPRAWLTQQRVRYARRLLETTDYSVDEVAETAGLGSAATLRYHLGSSLGLAPLAYRRTFQAADCS